MLQREGRLGHPQFETEADQKTPRKRPFMLPDWETPLLVLFGIALLIAGAVSGLNWVNSLFPN